MLIVSSEYQPKGPSAERISSNNWIVNPLRKIEMIKTITSLHNF
ncbi:hypothetical protein YN1HA_8780 [Sulfurisphaera ohwakuensis]